VVMVMGPVPHARRIQCGQAERQHDRIGKLRSSQNRPVLMVMIKDEESDNGQSRQNAEGEPQQPRQRTTKDDHESAECSDGRPQMPPTAPSLLTRKRTNRERKLLRIARTTKCCLDGKADNRARIDDDNRIDDGNWVNGHLFLQRRGLRGCRSDPNGSTDDVGGARKKK
jgi:hypothetical protein